MKHSNQSIDLFYKTPVIVMGGINHGHFASGDMPPNVKMHDIPVDDDVTFDSAHKTIARHVTNFIASTIGQPLEYYPTALSELKAAFQDTKSLMQVRRKVTKSGISDFYYEIRTWYTLHASLAALTFSDIKKKEEEAKLFGNLENDFSVSLSLKSTFLRGWWNYKSSFLVW